MDDEKEILRRRLADAEVVCSEAYQVMGILLWELGIFGTEQAVKILDNLAEHRPTHPDVLPWVIPKVPKA